MTVHHLPTQTGSAIPEGCVTTQDLCTRTGLSYRRADYYTRTGLLTPINDAPGYGYPRYYSLDQVDRARALKALLDAGVALPTCRQVIDEVLTTGHADLGPIHLTYQPQEAS